MKRNTYIHVFFSAIVLLITVSFSSCKKEKDLVNSGNEGAKLVFNVSSQIGSAKSNKLASVKPSTPQANATVSIGNRISMITNSEETSERESVVTTEHKFDKKIALTSSPVHLYTHYRVLLYNVTKGSVEMNVEAVASDNLEIPVTPGDQYKWYAYSYNADGRIDTPTMVNGVPHIRTIADKEFLWASSGSSTITATNQPIDVSITFDHRMAEVAFEIDITELHGTISDLRIDLDDPNYFNTAEINLFTGAAVGSTKEFYNVPELSLEDFEYDITSDSTILRAVLYTAIPSDHIENLKVHIRKMTVLHDNNVPNTIHKLEDAAKSVQFSFTNPDVSKSHVAKMKFRYLIPTKKILHVIEDNAISGHNDDMIWSFAAQPLVRTLATWSTYDLTAHTPPLNMLKAPLNFGNLSNSIVHTDGFTHERALAGQLATKLSTLGSIPDIVIISVYYYLTDDDITALVSYLNNGGVVLMMTDSAVPIVEPTKPNEVLRVMEFFRRLFPTQTISYEHVQINYASGYDASLFVIDPNKVIDNRITNGPFGNLSGKYWGLDTRPVVQVQGLPIGDGPDQVTVYSDGKAVNNSAASRGTTMFKHNSKNLFWIGDGSFLSHSKVLSSGYSDGWNAEPFGTVGNGKSNPETGGPNHTHYPIPKPYGVDDHALSAGYSYGAKAYNAPLFANLMAWAVYQSEFFGINRGSFIPTEIKDWNVNGGSVNINYNR